MKIGKLNLFSDFHFQIENEKWKSPSDFRFPFSNQKRKSELWNSTRTHQPLLCSYFSEAWSKPMLELPTAHYFLSDKVGAAHWVTYYVIQQSELPMGIPWSDIIMRFKVSGQLLPTELPMCSPWADIIMSLYKQWAVPVHWAAHCFSWQPMCSTWAAHGQPTFHFRVGMLMTKLPDVVNSFW